MMSGIEDFVANPSAKQVSKLSATQLKPFETVLELRILEKLFGVHFQIVAVRNFEQPDDGLVCNLESMETCFAL